MSTSPNQRKIMKMTSLWAEHIGKGYGKERDVHWCIETDYSGGHPTFTSYHHGYVGKYYSSQLDSMAAAEAELVAFLKDAFLQQVEYSRRVLESAHEYDEFDVEQAVFTIEKMLPECAS